MSHDIRAVANYVISYNAINGEQISHVKIHKICFLIQGWSLVLLKKPIISDKTLLCKYGPTYKKIYNSCAFLYGGGDISFIYEGDLKNNFSYGQRGKVVLENFSDIEKKLMDTVCNIFCKMTITEISYFIFNEKRLWYKRAVSLMQHDRLILKDNEIKEEFNKMVTTKDDTTKGSKNIFGGENHIPVVNLHF